MSSTPEERLLASLRLQLREAKLNRNYFMAQTLDRDIKELVAKTPSEQSNYNNLTTKAKAAAVASNMTMQFYSYQNLVELDLTNAQMGQLMKPGGTVTVPAPPPPASNKPMDTEFQVGDILEHQLNNNESFRVVRLNKNDIRMEYFKKDDPDRQVNGTCNWTHNEIQNWGTQLSVVEAANQVPKTKVDFDSVIIPEHKKTQILQAVEQINQSDLIFKTWGFAETIEKGRGVSILFYGPPGTGKTLMAQAIANKFDYKLKVIAVADIQSSAPGEAERNIRKHFKEAKGGKTILLFDECDSLIYTRENVGPIMAAQINELLTQIERFDGITVFTTNRLGTLDEAFNSRLALKLEFDIPTPEERVLIWQRMFPKNCPLAEDIDWLSLASIEVTGRYIKNCVLRAARMAACEPVDDSVKQITMAHLKQSLIYEAESMVEFTNARETHKRGVGYVVSRGDNGELTRGGA